MRIEVCDFFRVAFKEIQNHDRDKVVIPPIIPTFEEIIDHETKRFLISSETVKQFAYEYLPDDFDYSLPGSGLWKAVERELNLSLVLYLRQELGVAQANEPWIGIENPSKEVKIKAGNRLVNLNQRESIGSSRLKGFTLGNMEHILRSAYENDVYTKLEMLFEDDAWLMYLLGPYDRRESEEGTLPSYLQQIKKLRNRYAHISAMSREQFKELRNLVLSSHDHPKETCLGKILELKKKVLNYSKLQEK